MEWPKEWPEPIVRVQSLSGSSVIPDRYVKPPSERPGAGADAVAYPPPPDAADFPVINLGGLDGGGESTTMTAVSKACEEWGFFQVINHGVSSELITRFREVWREFFYLPMEEKLAYANSPATFEGYGSRLGVEKGAILDWGDYYFLYFLPESIRNRDKWPALPSSLRETTEAYGEEMVRLCERLLRALSLSLGLDEGFFRRALGGEDQVGANLRVNYYPKCPQPELTLGLSAHSDPGGITVLLPDDHVRGLQVRRAGAWVTVEPITHALVVNIGDQIQVLSNGTYKSVEHRVMVNAITERFSMAFFYNPKGDLLIEPAKEFVTSDRPALYKPLTYNEYRMAIRKMGPHGKSQVESLQFI